MTKENIPVVESPLSGAIGDIGEVRDHLQAAQSYLRVGTVQLTDHRAPGETNEPRQAHLRARTHGHHHQNVHVGDAAREPQEATGICNLDLSNVADTSLTSSIFTEGGMDLDAMSVPSRPTSARIERPGRRVRPASSRPHLPALALEDNRLYKEFIRFSRGAWTVDIGQVAPAAASAVLVQPETRKKSVNHMELGSFLEFLKWADIVPRLTNSLVAHGLYDCISRDCAAAGLDGKMGHLGWVGFQQCVGMIAALVCLPQVLSNDVLQLLQASSGKQFGIFPSEVARQECEDGATSAFLEMFASQKQFNRFSSQEAKNKGRTMKLDQAVAVIHALKCNPMFITPSLVAQEFRKVARSSSSAQLVSPRAVNAATIRFEQFRAMMKAICHRIGPCLVIRTVCISLASHSAGVRTLRRDAEEPFDNGAPNPPHKPNPKAFLRPTRPSTAPRGLRPASRPPLEIKAENFLRPAPPKWRPGGHVDLKAQARKTHTTASSTMLSHSTFKGQNEFDQEELDFRRLCQEELAANSSHINPHGGAPQAKLYDKNLLPADMNDEQQRARHWAETHGHSHKKVHAQRQHVLEEQQHIAGQGGHAAPGDLPHGGAPQAKLYDKNLLPADMNDEQQRAQHWAETHGHSHKQVFAQRQHVLEEQQHIAGQGGHAAPGDLPHGGAPQAKLYDKNLLPADMNDERQRAQHWAETHGHKHSLSVSASSERSRKGSPERSLRRLERKAREDYARMLEMNNEVSLHYSIASWIDRTPIQTQGETNEVVDVLFSGGRVIRGGRDKEPEHLVPTAPAGRDGLRPVRGHKRLCPDPVYESVPVLRTPDHESVNTSEHRRGEMILRQAHEMANKATSDAM